MGYSYIMKLKLSLFLPFISLLVFSCASRESSRESGNDVTMQDSISRALDYHLSAHPASQYRDIYKYFMQDYFGPGHILADTAASRRYLMYELSDSGCFGGPLYEPTGFRGNFYRVNLSLIKDSIIPTEIFFNAFVESLQGVVPPSGDEWMSTWKEIDDVIRDKGIRFVSEESDRAELSRQFGVGDYIVHHSRMFNDSSRFHYRIITKRIFDNKLLPLINRALTPEGSEATAL